MTFLRWFQWAVNQNSDYESQGLFGRGRLLDSLVEWFLVIMVQEKGEERFWSDFGEDWIGSSEEQVFTSHCKWRSDSCLHPTRICAVLLFGWGSGSWGILRSKEHWQTTPHIEEPIRWWSRWQTIDKFTRNDIKAKEAWTNIYHHRSRSRLISFFPSKCGFSKLSIKHLNIEYKTLE